MTLQQLKYIIAVNRFRNFAKAADACDISQPTLSAMLAKLEEELDVRIFDRTNKRVVPTSIGLRIIEQAEKTLMEANRIAEMVAEDKGTVEGKFTLSVGPTIAPYILPKFILHYLKDYPNVSLTVQELKADAMVDGLSRGAIDAGIAISGNKVDDILEIPLYTEKFLVYLANNCCKEISEFNPENLEHEKMWIMKEAQCMRDSAFSFCKARGIGKHIYEAGSIETLIRIIDQNGGFTIIPEMHQAFLTEKQRANVRQLRDDFMSMRRVSLYIQKDFIRERMLNTITRTLMKFMPKAMMEPGIVKYGIRL